MLYGRDGNIYVSQAWKNRCKKRRQDNSLKAGSREKITVITFANTNGTIISIPFQLKQDVLCKVWNWKYSKGISTEGSRRLRVSGQRMESLAFGLSRRSYLILETKTTITYVRWTWVPYQYGIYLDKVFRFPRKTLK